MSDRDLLRKMMYLADWNQSQLGENIGLSQQHISHVINERKNLGKPARILVERLLEEYE